jgi:chromosome segregation ATPase
MDILFPKRSKVYKVLDRVIVTNEAREGMYMVRGIVRFAGYVKHAKVNMIGVEFDKLVRSKEDVRAYFTCKPGFGAFFDVQELCKIGEEKFDEEAFKNYIKANPGYGEAMKSKKEMVIEFTESQGDFGEESEVSMNHSNVILPAESLSNLDRMPSQEKLVNPTSVSKNVTPEVTKKKLDLKIETKIDPKIIPKNPKTPTVALKPEAPKIIPKANVLPSPQQAPKNPFADPPAPKSIPNELAGVKTPPLEIKKVITDPISKKEAPSSENDFIELQKLNLQVSNLQNERHLLLKQLEKTESEVSVLNHKYEGLKKMSDHSSVDQIKLSELNAELQSSVEQLQNDKVKLESQLEKFKDYEQFKKKFEKMSIESISMKEEADLMKEKNAKAEKELVELREQLEIIQLEAEIEALNEEEPSSADEYKNRYRLIKNAFQKLDVDLQIQKEEYEIKMEELNSEIIKLRSDSKDIMSSTEIKKIIGEKDRQIKDLHELVNDFAKSRETTEGLFADFRNKQEELEKAKENMNKALEVVKSYQEEIEEFEGLTKELEDSLSYTELKLCERENTIKELTEDKTELENKINKYKQKLAEIEEHKTVLESRQNANVEESNIDSATFTAYYQDYNKVVSQKQTLLKERMTLKVTGREDALEATKWIIYFEAIPKAILAELKISYFESYKNIRLNNDKIDIIMENLLIHYLFNEALLLESPSLVSMARDMFKVLARYQQYLNYLRVSLIACQTPEQFAEFEKSHTYVKIVGAFGCINDIFELIKENELSTQFAFSDISEGALQLKQTIPEEELHSTSENHYKFGILNIFTSLIDKYFDPATDSQSKATIIDVSQKLLIVNEMIIDTTIEERTANKIQHFSTCSSESLSEFKVWLDTFSKDIFKYLKTTAQIRGGLLNSVWRKPIEKVKETLENHEMLKKNLEDIESQAHRLESDLLKKTKEMDGFNKTKINLEGKILKLQGIANNISTLEYEISELRKIESRQAEEIEELSTRNKELDTLLSEKKQQFEKTKTNISKFIHVKDKIIHSNAFFKRNSDANIPLEYQNKSRFEINSLSAVLSHTLYQLNLLRNKEMKSKLQTLTEKAPSFANYYNSFIGGNIEVPKIAKSINTLNKHQSQIKNEISKMKVVDLTSKQKADETIKGYYQSKNKIKDIMLKSNEILLKGLKATQEGDLAYEIDLTKEVNNDASDRIKAIYGKLSFIGVSSGSKRPVDLQGNSLNIDVGLA